MIAEGERDRTGMTILQVALAVARETEAPNECAKTGWQGESHQSLEKSCDGKSPS